MALLLAPYNDAMRLGMGFNTFTQQLCVNDAVQLPGGIKASEKDLKVASAAGGNDKSPSGNTGEVARVVDEKSAGGTIIRTHKDGSQAVSQIVTWKSTFVNNISEVTENMNIKGSLAIKIDAVGGGAKAQASYLNTESFRKSDINYHLQVDVVNQRLVGENVTEFMPIKNVQPNQFQDVYGDSYISGFLEGGVFNAIISIELQDKKDAKSFGGELSIQAKLAGGAVEVAGSGGGEKSSSNNSNNDKITVSVSWSGGGDIITDEVEKDGWDMKTLKKVAIAFADKVAICPQKTNAILTKYSNLRSFYEKNIHGSPLDYENSGVYSSALLDAYMDYKTAWKELQVMSYEVDKDMAILYKNVDRKEIKEMADEAEKEWKKQNAIHNPTDSKEETGLVKHNPSSGSKLGKTLAPMKLQVYEPSVFGLDKAQRDCRFEMIKIVREVDAVAEDPQVAVDPERTDQFLSPVIFRQLMPKKKIVDLAQMEKDIESLKEELGTERQNVKSLTSEKDDVSAQLKSLQGQLETTKGDLESTRTSLDEANKSISDLKPRLKPFENEGDEKATLSIVTAEREATIHQLQKELEQEKSTNNTAKDNERGLNEHVQQLTKELDQAKAALDDERRRTTDIGQQLEALGSQAHPVWDSNNNLDSGFHGRTVQILNMHTMDDEGGIIYTLDMGGESATLPHAMPLHVNWKWQQLKLEKVNPSSRTSAWRIRAVDRYLYCKDDGKSLMCDTPPNLPTGCCEWWITKCENGRGYMIRNVKYGFLHLESHGERSPIYSKAFVDTNCQVWAIMGV